jgi:hypothetical protein
VHISGPNARREIMSRRSDPRESELASAGWAPAPRVSGADAGGPRTRAAVSDVTREPFAARPRAQVRELSAPLLALAFVLLLAESRLASRRRGMSS